jgi:hypothetical protein
LPLVSAPARVRIARSASRATFSGRLRRLAPVIEPTASVILPVSDFDFRNLAMP